MIMQNYFGASLSDATFAAKSETMRKLYLSAPLPFQGQKRKFAKEYIKVLQLFPDGTTFVDLFGGSGLLSHITKYQKPHSTVVFNDFDGYRQRLEAVPVTNTLLAELRDIIRIPRNNIIPEKTRECVLSCLREAEHEYGYVDYITLSSSVMFSMKYATSLKDFEKGSLYNRVRTTDYPPCLDYLNGLTVVSCDYRELFRRYSGDPNVVFVVDPPYLNTSSKTYNMYWRLTDYLDVLSVLVNRRFVYFTSNKSSLIELCDWMGKFPNFSNPLCNCRRYEIAARMNYGASYKDIMLYTDAA